MTSQTINSQNQITAKGSSDNPKYDYNGNMTSDTTYQGNTPYLYDAWNRLVKIGDYSSHGYESDYAYTAGGADAVVSDSCGSPSASVSFYDSAGRVIETDNSCSIALCSVKRP